MLNRIPTSDFCTFHPVILSKLSLGEFAKNARQVKSIAISLLESGTFDETGINDRSIQFRKMGLPKTIRLHIQCLKARLSHDMICPKEQRKVHPCIKRLGTASIFEKQFIEFAIHRNVRSTSSRPDLDIEMHRTDPDFTAGHGFACLTLKLHLMEMRCPGHYLENNRNYLAVTTLTGKR
jgi:hypothetical protein